MNFNSLKNFALLRFFHGSIARRLTAALVVLGITATLITTAVQTYRMYLDEFEQVEARMERVRITHGPSLAASVWRFSERQIEIELKGLLNTPDFEYAEVRAQNGEVWSAGVKNSSDAIVKEFPMIFPNDGQDQTLGTLIVVAGKKGIYDRIKFHAMESLFYFGAWTFFLAGALYLIFRQLITRHLATLARYTSTISFDTQAPPLVLDHYASQIGSENELEQVASAINSMRTQLAESILDLQKSEDRYAFAVSGSNDGLWDWNIQTGEDYLSPRWKQILGYQDHELENLIETFTGALHPEDHDHAMEAFKAHLEDRIPYDVECRLRHKDGSYIWVHSKGQAIWDDDGKPMRMAGSISDITQRKQAEETSRRLIAAIEPLNDSVAIYDSDDRLLFWNEAYRKHHTGEIETLIKPGLKFEDLVRASVYSGRAPEAIGREEAYIAERMERHRNPGKPYEIRRNDRWYIYRESPTPEGGTTIVVTDTTEYKKAVEVQERLTQAVNVVPVGIALFDSDDRLVFFNDRYAELMEAMKDILKPGATFEEMIRTMVKRVPVKDSIGREEEFIQERINHHRNPTGPFDIRRENMWLMSNETKLPDGSIFNIITDITERKEAEKRLMESESLFRTTINNLPLGIYVKNLDGRFQLVNETMANRYGLSTSDFIGKINEELFPENIEGNEASKAQEHALLKTKKASQRIQERTFKDKTVHTLLIDKFPIFDESGDLVSIGITSFDLTEKKETEKALQMTEQRLSGAIESLQEGFVLFDAEDRLVLINDVYRQINPKAQEYLEKGIKFEELIRANVEQGIIVEAIGREDEFTRERLEQHRNPKGFVMQQFFNGRWYVLKETRTPEGGAAVTFADVTDLKKAEETVKQSAESFKDFAEAGSDWFWEMDENFHFTSFAGQDENTGGLPVNESIGNTPWGAAGIDPEDSVEWRTHLNTLKLHQPFRDFEFSFINNEGEKRFGAVLDNAN